MNNPIRTVLFDLDGTLLDTAPDLGFALNTVLIEQQREPLPMSTIRPIISLGAGAMITLGFALNKGDPEFEPLRQRLLTAYADHIADHTCLFPGMDDVLVYLETHGIQWGIVTNKSTRYTVPLLERVGLAQRGVCTVSGDTLPEKKPHPAPLLHACQLAKTTPAESVYVGDALRDIEAGQRAGMRTLVALYGYIDPILDTPDQWGATGLLQQPGDLLSWLHLS